MSVLMTLRVKGDAKRLEELASQNAEQLQALADDAKTYGLISHRFYGSDDEIMVVDEWPDRDSFQRFFGAHPEISELMGQVGVTSEPAITFWRKLDTHDDVP